MSSTTDSEVFRGKASAYVLDDNTQEWIDRGASGTLIMYTSHTQKATIKWTKNSRELCWKIDGSKLKPKGERAWVMKATLLKSDTKEILALRFQDSTICSQFATKFHEMFPASAANVLPPRPYNPSYMYMPAPPPPPPPPHPPMITPSLYMPNLSANSWKCQMCTLWNDETDDKCQACTSPNYPTERIVTRYNSTRVIHQKQILDRQAKMELSVTGYCRNIEQLLNTNILQKHHVIIPSGIIHLCFMFYVNNPWDFILDILSKNFIDLQVWQIKRDEFNLLCRLKRIAEYLLNEDTEKYRTLYLSNFKLRNKILKHDGALLFLHNLGFLLDVETNDRLICQELKSNVIDSCIESVTEKCKELKDAFASCDNCGYGQSQLFPSMWTCTACGLQNHNFLSRCDACGILDANKWECNECTYSNDIASERCAMCNAKKPLLSLSSDAFVSVI